MSRAPYFFHLAVIIFSFALEGCTAVSHNPKDPFESFNRGVYKFNDTVDKAVVKPVAKGYVAVVPTPVQIMLSNFFSNLDDVTVTLNDLLQFKIGDTCSDAGRIVINTTFGILGFADVATSVGLQKHREDFGQTLGKWGVSSGPYLVLPLLGPSSIRDGIGDYGDSFSSVIGRIYPVDTRNQTYVTKMLGKRAALLAEENVIDEASIDQYAFMRDAYLQHRQSMVYDGNPPREKFDDDEEDSKADKNPPPPIKESALPATPAPLPDNSNFSAPNSGPSTPQ